MKAPVLAMAFAEIERTHPEQSDRAPDWRFRIAEVSAGHFVVEGRDRFGRIVSCEGAEPGALLDACIADAAER